MWDTIYKDGAISTSPSTVISNLMPRLKLAGIETVLDAGCGAGRHCEYLANNGFKVHGIDVSGRAIQLAEQNRKGRDICYAVGDIENLPYEDKSMDFVLANHSLEYTRDVNRAASELSRVLRNDSPILLRVVSTSHIFARASPKDIEGFSHVGECIKNGWPVHFFTEGELIELFEEFEIGELYHHSVGRRPDFKITVPLDEWVFWGLKSESKKTALGYFLSLFAE